LIRELRGVGQKRMWQRDEFTAHSDGDRKPAMNNEYRESLGSPQCDNVHSEPLPLG
jgi:hypothetical protein